MPRRSSSRSPMLSKVGTTSTSSLVSNSTLDKSSFRIVRLIFEDEDAIFVLIVCSYDVMRLSAGTVRGMLKATGELRF
jgi:hypothetical protein